MMRLNDKIIELRKQRGWSQEELAQQLGVTRQSVSKWEGAQSVPDIEKIVQMSRLYSLDLAHWLRRILCQYQKTWLAALVCVHCFSALPLPWRRLSLPERRSKSLIFWSKNPVPWYLKLGHGHSSKKRLGMNRTRG